MENAEEVLSQLNQYDKNPVTEIPQILEEYLVQIAKSGYTYFPWLKIKTLFKVKLENVIADFSMVSPVENVPNMPNVEEFKFEEMKSRIFEQLESYNGVPFTIQRLCELITQPYKNYKRIDKFLRGLERVMLVVSTIETHPVPAGGWPGVSNGFGGDSTMNLSQDLAGSSALSSKMDESLTKPENSLFNGSPKPSKSADEGGQGTRRLGDSLESPAKRLRLSIEEDGGPCDSADQVPIPVQNESPTGNECIPSSLSTASPTTLNLSSSPSKLAVDQSVESSPTFSSESMEIDTECTSSQARLELNTGSGEKESCEAVPDNKTSEAEPEVPKNAVDDSTSSTESTTDKADHVTEAPVEGRPANSAGELAGETEGDAAAIDLECGAEEGISTSAESGSAAPVQQVETNSEAEASNADKETADDQSMDTQQAVGSSESSTEARGEDTVGVADSSDEAEQSRPAPQGLECEPDQSESAEKEAGSSAASSGSTTETAGDSVEAGSAEATATESEARKEEVAADKAECSESSPDQSM